MSGKRAKALRQRAYEICGNRKSVLCATDHPEVDFGRWIIVPCTLVWSGYRRVIQDLKKMEKAERRLPTPKLEKNL